MLFCDTTGAKPRFAKDPCVVRFAGRYLMYYSVWLRAEGETSAEWASSAGERLGIGIAASPNLESWEIIGRVPIAGGCEARGIGAPGAVVLGDALHLFYQTYGNGAEDAICHAVSYDGLHFEKDAGNPVFSPSRDWCCGRAIDADVAVFHGRLYLYFATRDHAFRIQKIGVASADLAGDFSRGAWRQEIRQSVLMPEFPFEGECIEAPATAVADGKVWMFYGGSYNCTPQQIGVAVSCDAVHFDKLSDTPFLPCGRVGEWNSDESGHPYVFEDDDGRYYLFYQGTNDGGESWYISRREIRFHRGRPEFVTV